MTLLMELASTLIWASVCVYGIRQASAIATRFVLANSPKQATAANDAYSAIVPDDLVAVAMQYPDGWAQEDTLKAIRERYEQLQDWNRVRSAFGVGSIG